MRKKLDSPSLRQLRAFEAVARRKSIGAAAAELGLSQPAVTLNNPAIFQSAINPSGA
jgi:hypothetical protein